MSQTTNNAVFESSQDSTNTKNTTITKNMITTHTTPLTNTIPKMITITTQQPPPSTTTRNKHKQKHKQTPIHHYYTQRVLQSWLKTQRLPAQPANTRNTSSTEPISQSQTTMSTTQHNTQNQQQPTPDGDDKSVHLHQITLITPEQSNEHWGNIPNHTVHTFRLVMKNVNTISTTNRFTQWKATAHAAEQLHANILCLQEPNTNWHPNITTQVQAILCKASSQSKISTSSSLDNNGNNYQPGEPWWQCLANGHHESEKPAKTPAALADGLK